MSYSPTLLSSTDVLQEICKKTTTKDVQPFDVREQRLVGTEAEKYKVRLNFRNRLENKCHYDL